MSTEDMLTELPLATFELPQWLLQPAVRSCRLFNSIHKWIHGPIWHTKKARKASKAVGRRQHYFVPSGLPY
jgi:hypothetical protein